MYERLTDGGVAHSLCEYDTRNPACKGSKRAPCGNCVACLSGMAYMAHELLERREADKDTDEGRIKRELVEQIWAPIGQAIEREWPQK